jgi:aspartyl-tRNA(Asn)/glutamyl-tRNA(Gln) amidotransferase subunit A
LREKVRRFFDNYELLISLTLPVPPFAAGNNVLELPERSLVSWVYYTYPFNLTDKFAGFTTENLTVR